MQAQDKPDQLTEKLTPLQILELNELAALKSRMGGGVTEQLKGVVEGADPNQQFLKALKTLVQEQGAPQLELRPLKQRPLEQRPLEKTPVGTTPVKNSAVACNDWPDQPHCPGRPDPRIA